MSMEKQPNQKERVLTWDEVMMAVELLAKKLPVDKYRYLWGLPRNGLILAGLLAHQRPDLKILTSSPLTPGAKMFNVPVYVSKFVTYAGCLPLIIDDIHDSGEAAREWILEGFPFATLFWRKKDPQNSPTYFIETVEDESWLRFPWEK